MKSPRAASQAALLLLCAIALHCRSTLALAQAQTAPHVQTAPQVTTLPALESVPQVLSGDELITLSLPANTTFPGGKSAARVAFYEHGRPTRLADIKKSFALQNGRWSTQLRLEADPGLYDFRVVADDKARTPLSQPATVLIPGIVREPGWWLLNGSPFVELPNKDDAPEPIDAPLFISGLRRDAKGKSERRIVVPSNVPLRWRVLYLPSLSEIVSAKEYDYARLQSTLAQQIEAARAKGGRNYLGFVISDAFSPGRLTDGTRAPVALPVEAREVVRRLRQITTALQPDAALIFETTLNYSGEPTAANLEVAADLCDAVVLQPGPFLRFTLGDPLIESHAVAWAVKAARRIAEEQARYDLPIFLISPWPALYLQPDSVSAGGVHARRKIAMAAPATELWMAGASGGVLASGDNALADLHRIARRNASLFIGSVTLEDVGLLPLSRSTNFGSLSASVRSTGDDDDDDAGFSGAPATSNLYSLLTSVGRTPGLARLQQKQDKKIPESFMTILGDSISAETIEKLIVAARGGATLYLEGAPKLENDSAGTAARWSTLVGAQMKAVDKKTAMMSLDDPWFFGASRCGKVPVRQSVEATLNPATKETTSGKKPDEPEKGKDVLTAPRIVARLEDGTPALIENPVGDGRVLWSPHRVQFFTRRGNSANAPEFYNSVASQLQAALVQIRPRTGADTPLFSKSDEQANSTQPEYFMAPPIVRAAIRRSPRGAWLVGLFNESTQAAPITLEANHFAGVALDLATEEELPLRTRGNRSFVQAAVPAHGWQIIALSESRKLLDEERFAPRSKAKLK